MNKLKIFKHDLKNKIENIKFKHFEITKILNHLKYISK